MKTAKQFIFIGFLFIKINLLAQVTRVIYKYQYYDLEATEKSFKENKDNAPDYVLKIVRENFEKSFKKEYELVYDKSKAIFFKTNSISSGNFDIKDNDVYYKNLPKNEKIYQTNFVSKKTNVIIKFHQYDWQITNETKFISGYKCFKATLQESKSVIIGQEEFFYKRFVWFTPEIPASFGPQGFDGLPGLVLETAENDKLCLRAVKIEFNLDKNIKIEKPVASKSIKLDEFEAIEKENFKKMQDEMGN